MAAGVLQDPQGNVQPGRQVNVFLRGTSAQVTVWADAGASTTLSQPLTSDANGLLPGWVAGGQSLETFDVVTTIRDQAEPLNASDVALGLTQINGVAVTGVPSVGQVPTAIDSTDATWQTPSGGGGGAVSSVFTRTGAVVAGSGDYTAAQVTNAADMSSGSQQAFTGEVQVPDLKVAGLTGATAASRHVGATATGAPTTGTFLVGDHAVDQSGAMWVCTVAGTAGTWAQVGGSGLSGGTAGGGAETATNARTSTIIAPVLRDFVSVKDYGVKGNAKALVGSGNVTAASTAFTDGTNPFVSGDTGKTIIIPGAGTSGRAFTTTITYVSAGAVTLAAAAITTVANGNYQFGTDDTTNLQTAETNAAAGQLYFPPAIYLCSTLTPGQGITRWGYGATIYQIPGQVWPVWNGGAYSGTIYSVGFRLFGFTMIGEGQITYANEAVFNLTQWSDIWVRDCTVSGFANQAFGMLNCQRVWIQNNEIRDCTMNGHSNAISYGAGSLQTTNASDFVCTGNWLYGNIVMGAIDVIIPYPHQTTPVRVIITDNIVDLGSGNLFAGIAVEANTGSNTGSYVHQVIIGNNVVNNASTGNNVWAMSLATNGSTDSSTTQLQDFLVQGNIINSSCGGMKVQASNCTIQGNIVHAGGGQNTHNCLYLTHSLATGSFLSQCVVTGNQFHQVNATTTVHNLRIGIVKHLTITENLIWGDTGLTGGGDAINLTAGGSTQWIDIRNNRIETPWQNGINWTNMWDGFITGNVIYNPNASNGGSSVANGIYLQGTPGGTRNVIANNTIYDDRGTHLMSNAVQMAGFVGTLPYLQYNNMSGATAAITNSPARFGDIRGNVTDTPNTWPIAPSQPTAPASTVALTSADAYDADYYISSGTVSAITFKRNGGSALAVSSGTNMRIQLKNGDQFTITYTVAPTITKVPIP